jgi:predicted heme/steroid binding protein
MTGVLRVTLEEMLRWKQENQQALTAFQRQHREVSGVHFMSDDGKSAYVEFALKSGADMDALAEEIEEAFPDIDYCMEIVDPDAEFHV